MASKFEVVPVENTKNIPGKAWIVSQSDSEIDAIASLEHQAKQKGVTLAAVVYTWGKSKTGQVYFYAPIEKGPE